MLRFLYLNIYGFILCGTGILTLVIPFYWISKWTLVLQSIVAIKIFAIAIKLFSTWSDKKRSINILIKKNRGRFRPESFEEYMQAPCGKLVVRQVLKALNRQEDYKMLLTLQKPLLERWRNNCTPVKTVVYINKDKI